ncbi:MAG: hypothetical protein WAM69_01495 [Candidatus Sulfotelmatobacter sp.]
MIVLLPTSLMAQDSGRAMLYSDQGVQLNGRPVPNSSAIFPHDWIQTQPGTGAKIDAEGSTALVQPETVVQFNGDELILDHGSLRLDTARKMRVRASCVTVTPITADQTQYDVTDVDGRVKVAAIKSDVKIHYEGAAMRKSKQAASSDVIVRQGEQATREEGCGAPTKSADATSAVGPILNSNWAKVAGIVAVGVIACFGLCHEDNPISPTQP